MRHRPQRHPGLSAGARASRALAALVVLAALAACAPYITVEAETRGEVRVEAESSGGLWIVRIPESRPRQGVEVRRQGRHFRIPPGHYPPPGQCRIWDPELPPGQQAPPGPCPELDRRVPEGQVLVVGG